MSDQQPISKHPVQPVQWDGRGVVRFKGNAIVRYLLDFARARGCSLNELAVMPFTDDDWTQLAQLMGYSVSGAGDLSYFDPDALLEADRRVEELLAQQPTDPKALPEPPQ